jgi:sec-independent protein translocase protein TatA
MNFGNLGFTEVLILVLILVLFFGARRIPEIGASIGQGIKEFKRGLKGVGDNSSQELPPSDASASSLPPERESAPKRQSQ